MKYKNAVETNEKKPERVKNANAALPRTDVHFWIAGTIRPKAENRSKK